MPTFYYRNFEDTWKLAVSQKSDQCQFFPYNTNYNHQEKRLWRQKKKINKNHQRENTLIFLIPHVSLFLKKMYMHGELENLYVNIVT